MGDGELPPRQADRATSAPPDQSGLSGAQNKRIKTLCGFPKVLVILAVTYAALAFAVMIGFTQWSLLEAMRDGRRIGIESLFFSLFIPFTMVWPWTELRRNTKAAARSLCMWGLFGLFLTLLMLLLELTEKRELSSFAVWDLAFLAAFLVTAVVIPLLAYRTDFFGRKVP